MDGLELFILAIGLTSAIFIVGCIAKVYCLLRKDCSRSQSVLEFKSAPQPFIEKTKSDVSQAPVDFHEDGTNAHPN